MLPVLAYFHGKPISTGLLRSKMSDFKVFEQLPFEPSGEGEHLFIHIRKTGANTLFVARELAKYFKVKESLVTYAGMKDRFAVTEQWFGVHVPGKQVYDLSDLDIEGVEVLRAQRHHKKLRIGALSGNVFEITLRDVTEIEALKLRWQAIAEHGVPNYFGEQRFGINGGNIEKALALFSGTKVKDKKKRGIYLSAARSLIFNAVINERITPSDALPPSFNCIQTGDVAMLAGTQSVFKVSEIDDALKQRFIEKDIDLTAPMWGAGELMTQAQPLAIEQRVADRYEEFCQGLPRFGLKQERRRIRLSISSTSIKVSDTHEPPNNSVTLSFFLPAGCYATTVLRELVQYQDMTERVVNS